MTFNQANHDDITSHFIPECFQYSDQCIYKNDRYSQSHHQEIITVNISAAAAAAAAAKSLQLCLTLCDPIDSSPSGSPVPGILQARTLQWVAISFSNAWKWKVKVKLLSRVLLFATPWTADHQAPPFMGFSRQEYWSGVPLPSLIALLQDLSCTFWSVLAIV